LGYPPEESLWPSSGSSIGSADRSRPESRPARHPLASSPVRAVRQHVARGGFGSFSRVRKPAISISQGQSADLDTHAFGCGYLDRGPQGTNPRWYGSPPPGRRGFWRCSTSCARRRPRRFIYGNCPIPPTVGRGWRIAAMSRYSNPWPLLLFPQWWSGSSGAAILAWTRACIADEAGLSRWKFSQLRKVSATFDPHHRRSARGIFSNSRRG